MKVLRNQEDVIKENVTRVALTIGSFDGVHRGHRFLLDRLSTLAPKIPRLVITFDPHPAKILSNEPPPRIFSIQDQVEQFNELGVDYLYFLPFTSQMAQLSAEEFARQYIFDLFKPSHVLIGYDFAFGKSRAGDLALLKNIATSYNCVVEQSEPLKIDGQIASSSRVRELVRSGKMLEAEKILGRAFYLSGVVVEGFKRGRTIGVPTANLNVQSEIIPQPGVYFCRAQIVGADMGSHFGLCNVGFNPTVSSDGTLKIECHLLDFDQDIYGKQMKIQFFQKIREEKKFASFDDLKNQIQKDISQARVLTLRWPKV